MEPFWQRRSPDWSFVLCLTLRFSGSDLRGLPLSVVKAFALHCWQYSFQQRPVAWPLLVFLVWSLSNLWGCLKLASPERHSDRVPYFSVVHRFHGTWVMFPWFVCWAISGITGPFQIKRSIFQQSGHKTHTVSFKTSIGHRLASRLPMKGFETNGGKCKKIWKIYGFGDK